jgi:hypothetical protein
VPAANVELATKNSAASWCSCRWLRSQSDHKHRVTPENMLPLDLPLSIPGPGPARSGVSSGCSNAC